MIVVPAAQLVRNYYFSLGLVRSVSSYLIQVFVVNKNFFCFPTVLNTVAAIYCRINRRVQTRRFL